MRRASAENDSRNERPASSALFPLAIINRVHFFEPTGITICVDVIP